MKTTLELEQERKKVQEAIKIVKSSKRFTNTQLMLRGLNFKELKINYLIYYKEILQDFNT